MVIIRASKYSLLASIVLCLTSNLHAYAQQADRLRVIWEQDRAGDYIFYAMNESRIDFHVIVIMRELTGLKASTPLPFQKSVRPGKTRLFRLSPEGTSNPDFDYRYYRYPGVGNPKIREVDYALPVMPGKTTKAIKLNPIKGSYGNTQKPDPDFYAIGFKLEDEDTITAIRSGRITYIKDGSDMEVQGNFTYKSERNVLRVQHADGTFADYLIFKNGSAFAKVGDFVNVGDPLAIASGVNYNSNDHMRIMIQYMKIDLDNGKNPKDWVSYGFVTPKFKTFDGESEILMPNISYAGYLTDELIMQEMSKRQKKKYLKTKN